MSGTEGRATSRTLLARVRDHDEEAWDRLVGLYAPFVLQICRRSRLGAADAADVFQEVFQAAWTKITSFERRREGDTFRGWLRAIARNKVHDHFRRLERQPRGVGGTEMQERIAGLGEPLQEDDAAPPEDFDPERAESELLRAALELVRVRFQERTWLAFLGTTVDGRPARDVAEELGMSPGAVRIAKFRVLRSLRAELGDAGW